MLDQTDPARTRRIVVLDSNPVLISIVGVLRMAGHCVFQAYDGQAALELCEQLQDIDLLVLNTHVDGLSAPELIATIRERLPDILLLHIDTHREPTIPDNVETLTEPFTAEELFAVIDRLMAERPLVDVAPLPGGGVQPLKRD